MEGVKIGGHTYEKLITIVINAAAIILFSVSTALNQWGSQIDYIPENDPNGVIWNYEMGLWKICATPSDGSIAKQCYNIPQNCNVNIALLGSGNGYVLANGVLDKCNLLAAARGLSITNITLCAVCFLLQFLMLYPDSFIYRKCLSATRRHNSSEFMFVGVLTICFGAAALFEAAAFFEKSDQAKKFADRAMSDNSFGLYAVGWVINLVGVLMFTAYACADSPIDFNQELKDEPAVEVSV